jgi:hypothetical protein
MLEWVAGVASKIVASAVWDAAKGIFTRGEDDKQGSLSLNLGGATPYKQPLPPGVLAADRKTLQVLLDAFLEVDMYWLRTYDFGGSFRWSQIEKMQKYVWYNDRPEHEFLDKELERLRIELTSQIGKFSHLAGLYTTAIFHGEEDEVRKIPDQYENGEYSDARFFKKSGEINNAAEAVHDAYNNLVRRARLKLAMRELEEAGD